MSEPEQLGEILKRVFAEIEKTYGGRHCLNSDALTIGAPQLPVKAEEENGKHI